MHESGYLIIGLVTDYRLGGMNGEKLVAAVRGTWHGPIIVRSSERAGDLEHCCLCAGADLFLSKHEPTERLMKAVRALLSRAAASHR